MADPVLHLLAGPNGAGKSTLYEKVLGPVTNLEFVNADVIAARRWPGDELAHAYEASAAAAEQRDARLAAGRSFITETVFSHPSKVDLVREARRRGYRVVLHVVIVPVDLSVARVASRVSTGGHDVPVDKIRTRHARLWVNVAHAIVLADEAIVYDNSRTATPLRQVASFLHGHLVGSADWPPWAPPELVALV